MSEKMTSLEQPVAPQAEKEITLSKTEIDQQIEELNEKKNSVQAATQELEDKLLALTNAYYNSEIKLDEFKKAKDNINKRIQNPPISEALLIKFKSLFGKSINSKEDFIHFRPQTKESVNYQDTGSNLRDSITKISETKKEVNDLMGEKLSFSGGKISDKEKSPREESIEKVQAKILSNSHNILEINEQISKKRDEAFVAWKRENPEDAQKLENQEQEKIEDVDRVALFEDFLQTNPTNDEILEIFKNSFNYPKSEFNNRLINYFIKNFSMHSNIALIVEYGLESSELADKIIREYTHCDPRYGIEEFLDNCKEVGVPKESIIRTKVETFFASVVAAEIYRKAKVRDGESNCSLREFENTYAVDWFKLPLSIQEKIAAVSNADFPMVELSNFDDKELYNYFKNWKVYHAHYELIANSYCNAVKKAVSSKYGKINKFISRMIELEGIDFLNKQIPKNHLCKSIFGDSRHNLVSREQYNDFSEEALSIIKKHELKDIVRNFNPYVNSSWEENLERLNKSISFHCGENKNLEDMITHELEPKIQEWKIEWETERAKKDELKAKLNS